MPSAATILLRAGFPNQQLAYAELDSYAKILRHFQITARYGVFTQHAGPAHRGASCSAGRCSGWGIYLRDRTPNEAPPHLLDALINAA